MQGHSLFPMFERILILPDELKQTSESGLIVEEKTNDAGFYGTIKQVGHTISLGQIPLKNGDRVIFQKFAGQKITWNGIEYLMIMANDVLFKIQPDA